MGGPLLEVRAEAGAPSLLGLGASFRVQGPSERCLVCLVCRWALIGEASAFPAVVVSPAAIEPLLNFEIRIITLLNLSS